MTTKQSIEVASLLPPTDETILKVYRTIPEEHRVAWLYTLLTAQMREQIPIEPVYTWNQFDHNVAPVIPGLVTTVDGYVSEGINGQPLIWNYKEAFRDSDVYVPPMLDAFDGELLDYHSSRRPLVIISNHPTLATPYLICRSIIEAMGEEVQKRLFIVTGPQPTVMDYAYRDRNKDKRLSPVMIGRALASLVLTGPSTDSMRTNISQIDDFLRTIRSQFLDQYDRLMHPDDSGKFPIIVVCPAGRRAKQTKNGYVEYRADGALKYMYSRDIGVLPVGAYDTLLVDATQPTSAVILHPDRTVYFPRNKEDALGLHQKTCDLATSALGRVFLESRLSQRTRLGRERASSLVIDRGSIPILKS